jgi:LacI family transcriptional regulator
VSLGHRRFAVLTGPATVSTAVDRVRGFGRACAEVAGIPSPRIIHGAFTIESGSSMALAAVRDRPAPTAIFAANNFIAIGVLHALAEAGLRVPEDVAVVGFDDLPQEMVTFPFLTVAAQPAFEMGRRSVGLLFERVAGPGRPVQDVVLPTELVLRRSSGDTVGATSLA